MSMPLPPRRRRRARPGLIAAAALAAAAVIAVVRACTARPPGRHPVSRRPALRMQAGCLPGRRDSPAPGTVSTAGWYAVALDGTVVPASGQAGPRQGPWPLAAGFADTPAGAVLAAVNIAVRTSGQLGPAIFTATISRQVTGPGAQALLAAAWQDYAQASGQHPPASPGGPAGTASASPRAFRLLSWTPAAADVDVLAAADGQGAVIGLQVRWQGGDWRLRRPARRELRGPAARRPPCPLSRPCPGGDPVV